MDLAKYLNPVQAQAAAVTEGPLLLLAGAGSGKTRVLTYRMAYMVDELGISPFNILAITFTNKAAKEMKNRVGSIVKNGDAIWVSTFHSLCVRLLRRDIEKLGYDRSFTIFDTDDSEKLMKSLIKEYNINEKQFPPRSVLGEIGRQKDELIGPDEFAILAQGDFRQKTVAELYKAYQKRLKQNNALDFDDIISKTVELFTASPATLERLQERFIYIMVDEYQDTNTAQYQLVRLLSSKYKNLCVVGDDDQSIYGWRGANIRNILDFEKDFHNAVVIKLEQNYRSTNIILDAANMVISNNKNRKGKVLWTEKDGGSPIRYFRATNEFMEAEFIADTIEQGIADGGRCGDYALLYRTNAQSRVLEEQMVRRSIRYRIFGGVRFYERMEVKDILAYLKAVSNPYDEISLKRIINVPRRGIGDATIDTISKNAAANDIPFYDSLRQIKEYSDSKARNKKILEFLELFDELRQASLNKTVASLLQMILDKTNYLLQLKSENDDEGKDRAANVMELMVKAVEFEKTPRDSTEDRNSLEAFLEDVALIADIDNYTEDDDAVALMTLHSSKGLEFPNVFIPGFEENIFPSYRSIVYGGEKDLEEERRLCYVGITRAKERLYLLSAMSRRQFNQESYNPPSRFLAEIPDELLTGDIPKAKTARNEQSGSDASFTYDFAPKKQFVKTAEAPRPLPVPNREPPDYAVGDMVRQAKYGIGEVTDIRPAGVDYEVSVSFPSVGAKKFMAHLSKLEKITLI